MLPNPLHPAVVHFPLVLAMLLPLVAVASLYAIRKGARPTVAWGITTVVSALLLVSSWVSLETGEQQEERVEDVVSEQVIDSHADAAELFMFVAGGVLLVTVAGLARGRIGTGARVAASVATLAIVGAAINVGHSGGQLVYRYGAASAYATPAAGRETTGADATRDEVAGNTGERASADEKKRGDTDDDGDRP